MNKAFTVLSSTRMLVEDSKGFVHSFHKKDYFNSINISLNTFAVENTTSVFIVT